MYEHDAYLMHHGVKGQRWGIRRKIYQLVGGRQRKSVTAVKTREKRRNADLQQRLASKNAKAERHLMKTRAKEQRDRIKAQSKSEKRVSDAQEELIKAKARVEKNKIDREKYRYLIEDAINSGSAKRVKKYKRHMTTEEISNAIKRIELERKVDSLSSKELSKGEAKVKKATDAIGRYAGYGENIYKAYTLYNKISGGQKSSDSSKGDKKK